MFDIAPSELLVFGAVALLVIPPKDLPKAMRVAGYWVGRARGVARQFRSGFDTMLRDAELQEMEKRWATENERIMREHPPSAAILPATETLEHQPAPVVEHVAPTGASAVMVEQQPPLESPAPDKPAL